MCGGGHGVLVTDRGAANRLCAHMRSFRQSCLSHADGLSLRACVCVPVCCVWCAVFSMPAEKCWQMIRDFDFPGTTIICPFHGSVCTHLGGCGGCMCVCVCQPSTSARSRKWTSSRTPARPAVRTRVDTPHAYTQRERGGQGTETMDLRSPVCGCVAGAVGAVRAVTWKTKEVEKHRCVDTATRCICV